MTKKLEEGLTQQLSAVMPEQKARIKASNTVRGVYFMAIGTLSLLIGLGIVVIPMLILGEAPSVWLIAFGALGVVLGSWLSMMGSNAFSSEVADNEEGNKLILTMGKAIGLARGKITNGGK